MQLQWLKCDAKLICQSINRFWCVYVYTAVSKCDIDDFCQTYYRLACNTHFMAQWKKKILQNLSYDCRSTIGLINLKWRRTFFHCSRMTTSEVLFTFVGSLAHRYSMTGVVKNVKIRSLHKSETITYVIVVPVYRHIIWVIIILYFSWKLYQLHLRAFCVCIKTIPLENGFDCCKNNTLSWWKENHARYIIYYFITCSVQKIFHSVSTLIPQHN